MKIIIVGCGRAGAGLARVLAGQNHDVTVIDPNPQAFLRLGAAFKGTTVEGTSVDRDILIKAGIERADGLAAVTASDEVNAVVARVASRFFRVPRVVARLYDTRKAEIYRKLGLETIAPVNWGIHRLAEMLNYSRIDVIESLGTGEVDLVSVEIPPLLDGRPLAHLVVPGDIQVVAIRRGNRTYLPLGGTTLNQGDQLYLSISVGSIDRLQAMLGEV